MKAVVIHSASDLRIESMEPIGLRLTLGFRHGRGGCRESTGCRRPRLQRLPHAWRRCRDFASQCTTGKRPRRVPMLSPADKRLTCQNAASFTNGCNAKAAAQRRQSCRKAGIGRSRPSPEDDADRTYAAGRVLRQSFTIPERPCAANHGRRPVCSGWPPKARRDRCPTAPSNG